MQDHYAVFAITGNLGQLFFSGCVSYDVQAQCGVISHDVSNSLLLG